MPSMASPQDQERTGQDMKVMGDSEIQQIQLLLLWMTAVSCQTELTDEPKQVTCSRQFQL